MKESKLFNGIIENIKYKTIIDNNLKTYDFSEDVNKWSGKSLIKKNNKMYAVSKWVSPKRTRSYPYGRVYSTYQYSNLKRVTIIPIVKDEGAAGDRDFLQWSTVALMSLLNIYVIIGYYDNAIPSLSREGKITKQLFDDSFIKEQFERLENYHASPLHWNLDQLKIENLKLLISKVIESYDRIGKSLNITMHGTDGLTKLNNNISKDINDFKKFSSLKSQAAQNRELLVKHAYEVLGEGEKTAIVLNNYLGGLYYFTIDDVVMGGNKYTLMECKNSNFSKLPSEDDIKDGLLKMILYTNISKLFIDSKEVTFKSVLFLTSKLAIGTYTSESSDSSFIEFVKNNKFNQRKIKFLKELITEARENNFELIIKGT